MTDSLPADVIARAVAVLPKRWHQGEATGEEVVAAVLNAVYPKPAPARFHEHAETLRVIAVDLEVRGLDGWAADLRYLANAMDPEVGS